MPICEGLRREERADSRRPSPAMPLLPGAHLQACTCGMHGRGKGRWAGPAAAGGTGTVFAAWRLQNTARTATPKLQKQAGSLAALP